MTRNVRRGLGLLAAALFVLLAGALLLSIAPLGSAQIIAEAVVNFLVLILGLTGLGLLAWGLLRD